MRDAGAFDGPLGVLCAVACVERLRDEGVALPFAIDVLGFADEEGLRYGTAYLGSRALAGTWSPRCSLRDADGIALADALRAFGGAPDALASAARRGERLLGWCEVHIEQGPVLEERGLPVGVVTAIAGATRAALRFDGRAGHAGTVPMASRRDAACARPSGCWRSRRRAGASRGSWRPWGNWRRCPGRPTWCPAAPWPRWTCATPRTRCAGARWPPCAGTRSGSARRGGWRWRGGRSCAPTP